MTTQQIPFFVYGTLRSGEGNYSWALKGRTVAEPTATLTGAVMHDNNGSFPFVTTTDADETDKVVGDLMYIQPDLYHDVMADLDGLEGFYGPGYPGNMYERVIVTVVSSATGESVEAYTYLVADSLYQRRVRNMPVVESGDWIAHKRARDRRPATASYGW